MFSCVESEEIRRSHHQVLEGLFDFGNPVDMKRILFFLCGVTLLPFASTAEEGKGFRPIFDGKTLTGWDGKPGAWEVRDGEIWCTGSSEGKNWLIWREDQPGDFVLRMEFLWKKGNSGVQVRSDDLGEWQIFGYQVEVAQQEVMGLWHHSLFPRDHPAKQSRHLMTTAGETATISEDGKRKNTGKEEPASVQAVYREGEWNTLEIVAKGNRLTQKINGKHFATLIDNDAEFSRKNGFIALQDHGKGCEVAFRDIRLKKLP